MQKNTDPRGCLFGSILDNNTITKEKLGQNPEKYLKIQKNAEIYRRILITRVAHLARCQISLRIRKKKQKKTERY